MHSFVLLICIVCASSKLVYGSVVFYTGIEIEM